MLTFHAHTCPLIACLHSHCTLANLHLHSLTVFKGFSGKTLRNAFGKKTLTLLRDIVCRTLLRDTLAGHSCGTLSRACGTLLWVLVQGSCEKLVHNTHALPHYTCTTQFQGLLSPPHYHHQVPVLRPEPELPLLRREGPEAASCIASAPTTCFPHHMCATSCHF